MYVAARPLHRIARAVATLAMAALLLFGIGATDASAGHYTMDDCGRAYAVPMTAALIEAGRLAGLGIDPRPSSRSPTPT